MNVASFNINHERLKRGVYVSRIDRRGREVLTTFDVRIKKPNTEPPIEISAIHTLEHLLAVYLRGKDSGISQDVVYVGPMGCRTGMYIVLWGERTSREFLPYVIKAFEFVRDFEGEVPAATARECGNYLDHNLTFARYEAEKFLGEVLYKISEENLNYPE